MILIIVVVGQGLCNAVFVFVLQEVMISAPTGELIWIRGYMSLLIALRFRDESIFYLSIVYWVHRVKEFR